MEPPARQTPNRSDLVVLVVEDELFIAMELEMVLQEAGFQVLGPAMSVKAGLDLLTNDSPDVAVLDVNLRGEIVTPVAKVLRGMGVPFVLSSAYSQPALQGDDTLAGVENIGKPAHPARLVRTLDGLVQKKQILS